MHRKVLLCYKNFGAFCGVSHIGLGVSAINTCKVLNGIGIPTDILPMKDQFDLRKHLNLNKDQQYTHVVVSAPWISTAAYSQLCAMFPRIKFAMNCHSNVGFLQADANGIQLMREQLALEHGTYNFKVAANSKRLVEFIQEAYGDHCIYLPNLYFISDQFVPPLSWHHCKGTLRIGIFGATRSLKNILSAVGACLIISKQLKVETEIWVSTGREDGGDVKTILRAIRNLTNNVPNVCLKQAPWASWPQFRKLVGSMHLLLQPSYTESFNMVTADGASEGVPSVVSSAISWAPREWRADVDDVENIARTGVALLHDQKAAHKGYLALKHHNKESLDFWWHFLDVLKTPINFEL